MAIIQHDDWEVDKGKVDAGRHQKKIDDAIRKGVRNVIGEESIITQKGNKKVKVPVKGLKDYKFIHGSGKGVKGGLGQGQGKPGDILDRREKGQGQDKAGNEKGENYIEAEVDIDYLIEIMFDDLGLPWLEEKNKKSIEIPKGWKFESISKVGTQSRIHKVRTMKEAIKRNTSFIGELIKITNCSKEDAKSALKQARGDILKAIEIISNDEVDRNIKGVNINNVDFRYKQIEEDIEICSKAVVIAMMDVSASMSTQKKYLCRSLLFWMVNFLRKVYEQVDIRFIQHTTEAIEVDEDSFFKKATTGGTYCHSAFDKANNIIDSEYPLDEWNVYSVYCSDGEDFDENKTINSIENMLSKKINMLSYIEIKIKKSSFANLFEAIKNNWSFKKIDSNREFWMAKNEHFLASIIKSKTDIWPCLEFILNLERENINE